MSVYELVVWIALTTVADLLTCMDLQVLYLYSLLR